MSSLAKSSAVIAVYLAATGIASAASTPKLVRRMPRVGTPKPSAAATVTKTAVASKAGVAALPAIDASKPFVVVKVPQMALHLGDAYGPGVKQMEGRTVARVTANCRYHLSASFEGLKHEKGKAAIAAKDMTVTINGQVVPAGKARVPIVTDGSPTPGMDVPIDLQVAVKGLASYPAGQYGGALVFTIMARP